MIDPRLDLQLALDDYHVARIGGVPHRCAFSDPGVDLSGVQTAGVTLAMVGYRASNGSAVIQSPGGVETTLAVGATITEVELFPKETRGPYTVSHVEPIVGGMVRVHCRGSA